MPLQVRDENALLTNRFQNERDSGAEAKGLCSTSSITKLAITAENGHPIAIPKTC